MCNQQKPDGLLEVANFRSDRLLHLISPTPFFRRLYSSLFLIPPPPLTVLPALLAFFSSASSSPRGIYDPQSVLSWLWFSFLPKSACISNSTIPPALCRHLLASCSPEAWTPLTELFGRLRSVIIAKAITSGPLLFSSSSSPPVRLRKARSCWLQRN